ncbi:uncharacterized protein [Ptychodera flava]|uniref:uncharacterized protein isoform X4 n=1 Tax=Ptychodera flava TaxID=63121 RepID=UPI00396A0A67
MCEFEALRRYHDIAVQFMKQNIVLRFNMLLMFLFATLLPIVLCDSDEPYVSEEWKCSHLKVTEYDGVVTNAVVLQEIDCTEELWNLRDELEESTPFETKYIYKTIGPFIEGTKTFRLVNVLQDELDTADLGSRIKGEEVVMCFNGTLDYYNGHKLRAKSNKMEECPERLAGDIWWDPSGEVTWSTNVMYCTHTHRDDYFLYYCIYHHPEVDIET